MDKSILQLYLKTLCFVINILFQVFKFVSTSVNSKNILILSPKESLKPGVGYQELFDYSQTASKQEVSHFVTGDEKNGDVWLGRYLTFRSSKALISADIWLPNEFLHQHVLIVGAPGSGKTEFLLKSAQNLMLKGNLVCVDAAGFLGDRFAGLASSAGSKLVCWDLSTTRNRGVWNFLEELEKFGREKEIRAIAEAIYGNFSETDL
ncbi:hypothetical protein [Scytonema sp. NUACC26]|uniref:hypothetical protein n=1 Tax=Scytonema sp. NUACC26 TaxID=3140176 RepID=UPI0034DC8737